LQLFDGVDKDLVRKYRTFIEALEALAARDAYFYALTMFGYVGRKADPPTSG
jgi:hypothetical protein